MKKIQGVIKHYDWGGFEYLPQLLKVENNGLPCGEYWLGTHPDGMAVIHQEDVTLRDYLGYPLPFLLKILDVRNMLSIQVHPDKATAEKGFAAEENSGKNRNAYDRVYKDDNHKPELMVALSPFWLLQGFKSDKQITLSLRENPELKSVEHYFSEHGLKKTYEYLMTMPQEEVNAILKPLGRRIKPLYIAGLLKREQINFWAARAFLTYNQPGICDRGIFSLYLMNLIRLEPGQGVYQAPGVLHAYLEGQNIECMAASDNVIRGGLTNKHIDTDQLLQIVQFTPANPQIIQPTEGENPWSEYRIAAREFRLLKIKTPGHLEKKLPGILMNVGAAVILQTGEKTLHLMPGESIIIKDDAVAEILTQDDQAIQLYFAFAPGIVPSM